MDSWEAHNSPVQAVIKLPSGELATGVCFLLRGMFLYKRVVIFLYVVVNVTCY